MLSCLRARGGTDVEAHRIAEILPRCVRHPQKALSLENLVAAERLPSDNQLTPRLARTLRLTYTTRRGFTTLPPGTTLWVKKSADLIGSI